MCELIAIEAEARGRAEKRFTQLHRKNEKAELFAGFSRTYYPKDSDGDHLPPEQRLVQAKAPAQLATMRSVLSGLFNLTASKDRTNCHAMADVVVDGQVLFKDAPATFLLWLEKQVREIRTFVDKLPVLDPAYTWVKDEAANLWKTAPIETNRTQKVPRPIVLYEATKEHPAQTQMINDDVVVGHFSRTEHSGALREVDKTNLLLRIDALSAAVKQARERANLVEVTEVEVGDSVFAYLLDAI